MRTLILSLLAAAALAIPAAALADGGHGKGHEHATKTKAAASLHADVAKNAARTCRAERENDGLDAFRDNYGTNHNKRNAFGKCVSSHTAKELKGRMVEFASGAISSFGAAGCNASTAGCVLAASGTIEGKPIQHGTFTATLTAVWTSATSNGDGGYCAPTTGTVTLSDGTNTLTESLTGNLCEIGPTGTNVGHVFAGHYTIASGTGTYAGATGGGKLGFYQPSGSASITGVEWGKLAASS
jgi:hypothetical protein